MSIQTRVASEMLSLLRDTACGVADLVWPPECVMCHTPGERFLCLECREQIVPLQKPLCPVCGKTGVLRDCHDCSSIPWASRYGCNVIRSLGEYSGLWRDAVHQYKINGMRCMGDELADMSCDWIMHASASWRDIDYVSYIPGRFVKRLEVGFAHAEMLAKKIASRLDLPVVVAARRTGGRKQVGLTGKDRIENARLQYVATDNPPNLTGARVLLIDDVVTTTATAHVNAALLRQAGAVRVRMLSLARSV